MKKKGFVAVIVVCVVIIGCCTGGLSLYLLHSNQKQKEESAETIARLEENIEKANQKADDAALEAKKAKEKSEDSKKKVKEYKEKLEQLETNEEVSATPIPTEIPTSTPEPIPEETIGVTTIPGTNIEIGAAECARDHAGVFSCDSGYLMNILYGADYDDDMYFSCQDTVPGAHGYNRVEGYGKWENDVFTYTGTRYSNDEVVGPCNGTVTHVPGTNNLQWTDSMGGTNIGPFYGVPS